VMEIQEVKDIINTYHSAGRTREEAVAMVSSLEIDGDTSPAFEYCDLVFTSAPAVPDTRHFTDAENAEYFAAMYADRLRYDHRRGRWLEWSRHYWREDNDGQVTRLALKAVRERFRDTAEIEDLEARKDMVKKVIAAEQRARLDALLGLARDFKPVADAGDEWDLNPWLFCVANGVVDLRTGNFREGKPSDRITQRSPVKYDPGARSPRWLAFQDEVTCGDTELIKWKKKFYGYCLTGITNEQCFVINYGRGANGKGRELAVMRYVFGDYACNTPFSTFELSSRAQIPNDLAALVGKRLVTSSETNEGTRLNEARIKMISGEDPVTARFLNHEFFTFMPVLKVVLAVNNKPLIYDDTYGIWRKVRLVPFNRRFVGDADDKELLSKLVSEASGILNWLIEGNSAWKSEGLEPTPDCIRAATKEYQEESDPLSEFLDAECTINPQAFATSSRLYETYKVWCGAQGIPEKERMTWTLFGRRMGRKFRKTHEEAGAVYKGITLKADGLLTGSKAMFTENESLPYINPRVSAELENPSEPVIPSVSPDFPETISTSELVCGTCGSTEVHFNADCTELRCPTGHVTPYRETTDEEWDRKSLMDAVLRFLAEEDDEEERHAALYALLELG
jgi:putative DNA primase/helicase